MFERLKRWLWIGRDDDRRYESNFDDKGRMLEMDEPMAGAGAQLSGENKNSETEQALKRAADRSETPR